VRVRLRVRRRPVELGGERHEGWLPEGAAVPLPTSPVVVRFDFSLWEEAPDSWILEWRGEPPDHDNDSWHARREDALRYAEEAFGIAPSEWHEVDARDA
jgi:hypothetical protein